MTATLSALQIRHADLAALEAQIREIERQVAERERALLRVVDAVGKSERHLAGRLTSLAQRCQAIQAKGGGVDTRLLQEQLSAAQLTPLEVEPLRREALSVRHDAASAAAAVNARLEQVLTQHAGLLAALGRHVDNLDQTIGEVEMQPDAPVPPPEPIPQPVPAEEALSGEERRRHERVPIQAAVSYESDHNFYTGFSMDLSDSGLFLATIDLLPRGTPIDLCVQLPNGQVIKTGGKVRWIREWNDATPMTYPGMGIEFSSLDPQAQQAVREFTQFRDALFFAE